ncbi:ubiquinone biosynthesis protein COQ9, mitochondrial [Contarinia nasturtii]|uniref:ubiquinone biosynthesis protein COQ9, mitochondrial n=1 Tax=Contarinia nasturtii TaxID=265458 RepID=UPI0012D47777|nr:ubiquinone biosynthesis protein COQ9, mitochondrial [Contarinia nasturtii]
MSNLSVLPKLLKLRPINHMILLNVRQLTSGIKSEKINTIVTHNCAGTNGTTIHHRSIENSVLVKRLVHTSNQHWKDDDTNKSHIDQFRADEVKIEREYEEKQKNEQQTSADNDHSTTENHEKIQKIRSDILDASLKFVATNGWSHEAIAHGAESINYPGIAHGMFPNGAIELIHHFYAKCNRELIEQLQREITETSEKTVDNGKRGEPLSPRDFAIKAIRMRLEMIIPYKDSWAQACAIMTLPQNVPTSLAHLLTLVDDICHSAGDRSVDIGWYTRRIGIASIYKMVELYMLQDKSPEHTDTWTFLERRMDEGIQVQEFLSTSDQKTQTMAKALGSAFQTARNILGINCDKR